MFAKNKSVTENAVREESIVAPNITVGFLFSTFPPSTDLSHRRLSLLVRRFSDQLRSGLLWREGRRTETACVLKTLSTTLLK